MVRTDVNDHFEDHLLHEEVKYEKRMRLAKGEMTDEKSMRLAEGEILVHKSTSFVTLY